MAILREVESAEGNVAHQTGMVRGAIRIGTTSSLARHFIIPALPRFRERYPNIKIDLHLSDTVVDLVQEGIDCVLRAGEPKPSSLIHRNLGCTPRALLSFLHVPSDKREFPRNSRFAGCPQSAIAMIRRAGDAAY
ncbi:LysR substrate-binding domain-containing protein [Phyllobacterium myrsinacearum]|uniref:LysR substrate-binding domain-containing protein n=1 Tax=Phyllobacterium myrsinacearum TaxID=28101 RepID=UPI0010289135